MRRFAGLALSIAAGLGLVVGPGGRGSTPAEAADGLGVVLQDAWPGVSFESPIHAIPARDGTDRIFVAERTGKILVLPKWRGAGPVAKPKTFLDLTSLMTAFPIEQGQGGLVTIAVPPDFKQSGWMFVFYGTGKGEPANPYKAVIAGYRVSAGDPDRADPASAVTILTVPKPMPIHFGGGLCFGTDGMLYVGLGEAGAKGDPEHIAQDTRRLEGKILRIDVRNPTPQKPYAIPGDNPWTTAGASVRPEIFAYGVRNPFRMSIDRETGNLWLGDPGQQRREEIDVVPRGGNLGWAQMEGDLPLAEGAQPAQYVAPVFAYGRDLGNCAIGGAVYNGQRCPTLKGRYVFADFTSGRVFALPISGARTTGGPASLGEMEGIVSITDDAQGELLLCILEDNKILTFAPAP